MVRNKEPELWVRIAALVASFGAAVVAIVWAMNS
jgi:hypothetical protein